MVGYWPSFFDKVQVYKHGKKRTRPTSNQLDQTSLVNKGFITWKKNTIFLRDTVSNPEMVYQGARSVSQSQCSFCMLTELAI